MSLTPEVLAALRSAGLALEPNGTDTEAWWYVGTVTAEGLVGGGIGPFESAEGALVASVAWLVRIAETAERQRYEMGEQLQASRDEVVALQRVVAALRDELRAEREAKG